MSTQYKDESRVEATLRGTAEGDKLNADAKSRVDEMLKQAEGYLVLTVKGDHFEIACVGDTKNTVKIIMGLKYIRKRLARSLSRGLSAKVLEDIEKETENASKTADSTGDTQSQEDKQ